VIQINFRSFDPQRAAEIANAVAEAYFIEQMEAKAQATRRAGIWLQDRIKELRDQASAAEQAVVDFKTKNNIVSTGEVSGRLMVSSSLPSLPPSSRVPARRRPRRVPSLTGSKPS